MTPTRIHAISPPDIEGWLTKEQAAMALSVSPKSVERYAKQGLLTSTKRAQRGAPALVVYSPADVEAVRVKYAKPPVVLPAEQTTVAHRLQNAPAPYSAGHSEGKGLLVGSEQLAATLAALSRFAQDVSDKYATPVYVSMTAATKLTGLARQTITEAAAANAIKTMPFGRGVRYRRKDLEAL
jgi:hypothetical protein